MATGTDRECQHLHYTCTGYACRLLTNTCCCFFRRGKGILAHKDGQFHSLSLFVNLKQSQQFVIELRKVKFLQFEGSLAYLTGEDPNL